MADRLLDFVKEKSNTIANKVHENITSVTDTTGALAKQKLLQHLISSGVLRSEQIRDALQIGESSFSNNFILEIELKNSCRYSSFSH